MLPKTFFLRMLFVFGLFCSFPVHWNLAKRLFHAFLDRPLFATLFELSPNKSKKYIMWRYQNKIFTQKLILFELILHLFFEEKFGHYHCLSFDKSSSLFHFQVFFQVYLASFFYIPYFENKLTRSLDWAFEMIRG